MGQSCSRPALVFLALVLVACGPTSDPISTNEPRPTRGYILISLDTLRADHLGCYGYARDTSPFLDQLAERSVLFENAMVQFPSTLTSHMSMFTGLYPAEHGVYPPDSVLSPEIETLPQTFQAAGFRTAGFTEGGYVSGRYGFRRGFDVFQARDRKSADDVERTFGRGLRFLEGLEEDQRFFLFLHTYSVHAPYEPPEKYREMFWDGAEPPDAFEPTGPNLSRVNALGTTLSPAVRDYFTALYDAEIRRLDDVLASFFAQLENLGLASDTTVIITSDHGEEFQEHGMMNHTQLYREVLHVPLLIHHPDLEQGARHRPLVRSVDLAPTFHRLARLEPRELSSGQSLVQHFPGASRGGQSTLEAYAEMGRDYRSLFHLKDDQFDHLLVFQPPKGRWWTRRLRLAAEVGGPIRFEIRSYQEPRTVKIRAESQQLFNSEIGPQWTIVDLPPLTVSTGESGRRTLDISSPTCTVGGRAPGQKTRGKKGHCYSFQVRGIPLARAELYDVDADPAETIDASWQRGQDVRSLYERLAQYQSRSKANVETRELDEKLRSELEALGYLQ